MRGHIWWLGLKYVSSQIPFVVCMRFVCGNFDVSPNTKVPMVFCRPVGRGTNFARITASTNKLVSQRSLADSGATLIYCVLYCITHRPYMTASANTLWCLSSQRMGSHIKDT